MQGSKKKRPPMKKEATPKCKRLRKTKAPDKKEATPK
jgi:hypothetical protein